MLGKLKNTLARFHRDERGAMSVEMVLILAAVGIPAIVLLIIFGKKIIAWFQESDQALDQQHN